MCVTCNGTGTIKSMDDDEILDSPCPSCKGKSLTLTAADIEGPGQGPDGGTGQ